MKKPFELIYLFTFFILATGFVGSVPKGNTEGPGKEVKQKEEPAKKVEFVTGHEGIIVEKMDVLSYTYLLLEKDGEKVWVAGPQGNVKVGDKVRIEETRPLSRLKRWRVVEIVVKGEVAEIKPEEITS